MEHHSGLMLRDALLMLGFALVAVLAFRRAGLGATLGYLVAGVLLGPQVFGLVGDAERMASVAELGIVMLLFVVGLELSPARLWRMKHLIFGLGLVQVVACGLAVVATILALTGYPLAAALAIGLPLGLSSTAQVLPMLQSGGQTHTPFGEKAFGILLFQDLSIIPLITIVAALSRNPEAEAGPSGWMLGLLTVGAIIGLIIAGRLIIRPLFHLIGGLGERELFVVAALFTVLASAYVMQELGLSAALGAFIAGVMLADTRFRHQLEADIEPFRSILLGLFFIAVGMMLDLEAVAEQPLFVVCFAALLIAVKTSIIMGLGLLAKMTWRAALALGLLLSQGGEFAFVLYASAQNGMLIAPQTASVFGAVVTLSMAATPFLVMATARYREEPEGEKQTREEPRGVGASALIVGYGRFGQSVSQTLRAAGLSVTVIDKDADQIDIAEKFGSKVYYGDGTRMDLLRQAGGSEAQLIMFCLDEMPEADLIDAVQATFSKTQIYVRAFDRRSVITLSRTKAQGVVREVHESAIYMARLALEKIGLSEEEMDHAVATYRENDQKRLDLQIQGGDIFAAQEMTREQQRELRGND